MRRFFILYTSITLAGILFSFAYAYHFLTQEEWIILGSETGTTEKVTEILFALVAALSLVPLILKRQALWLYFGVLMALAAMREMDLHKEWTTDSIFKLRFYTGDSAPLYEKLIGLTVILILLFSLMKIIRHIPMWLVHVAQFQPIAISILMACGALGAGKMLDSMVRILPFLREFHKQNGPVLAMIEESLEMTSAAFFLLVCLLALFFKSDNDTQ